MQLFKDFYIKISENGAYYFIEGQFDKDRNAAVLKIHKCFCFSTGRLASVLDFDIQTGPDYPGFGSGIQRYPSFTSSCLRLRNTPLISPLKGTLSSGETVTLSMFSRDFSRFVIRTDKGWLGPLKPGKDGDMFALVTEIPQKQRFWKYTAAMAGS